MDNYSIKISTEIDWKKVCIYIIEKYNINEEEVCKHIQENAPEFLHIKHNKSAAN